MLEDKQLSQYDIATLINNLAKDDDIELNNTIHLVTATNKQKIKQMIYNKKTGKDFFLLYYYLGKRGAHWASLVVDYDNRNAYFYCSYGLFVDGQFKYGDNKTQHDELVKSCLRRLYKLGFQINFNNSQLQHFNSNVCGRYCGLFLYFNMIDDIDPDEFNEIILNNKKKLDPDDFVLQLTADKF